MNRQERKETKINFYAGIFFLVLGGAVVHTANNFQLRGISEVEADFVPILIGVLMVLLGAVLSVSSALQLRRAGASFGREKAGKGTDMFPADKKNAFNVAICSVLLLAYAFSIPQLGFIFASIVYMFLQMCLIASKKLTFKRLAMYAVVSLSTPFLLNYIFFNVFHIVLPRGLLG